jgi:hypothetical protein
VSCSKTISPSVPTSFFFIFISIYSLSRGTSLWQFWIALHCTLVRSPPPSHPFSPSPPHLMQLQEVPSYISYMNMKLIHHIPSPSSSPFKFSPTSTPPLPMLQSCLSFFISKSMFKGVSRCIPVMNMLYFLPQHLTSHTLGSWWLIRGSFPIAACHVHG